MKKAEENGQTEQGAGHFVPSKPALAEGSVAGNGARLASVVTPGPVASAPRAAFSPPSSAFAGASSQSVVSASIAPPQEISRTRSSINLEPVQTLISNWAIDIRRTKADTMEVVLKPNPETEVALRLSLQHGSVDVAAELKRGDLAGVTAYWPQLQESLSGQGIRLGAVQSSNGGDLSGRASTGQFHQSDRHPASPELPEVLAPRTPLARAVPSQTRSQPPQLSPGRRAWESWA